MPRATRPWPFGGVRERRHSQLRGDPAETVSSRTGLGQVGNGRPDDHDIRGLYPTRPPSARRSAPGAGPTAREAPGGGGTGSVEPGTARPLQPGLRGRAPWRSRASARRSGSAPDPLRVRPWVGWGRRCRAGDGAPTRNPGYEAGPRGGAASRRRVEGRARTPCPVTPPRPRRRVASAEKGACEDKGCVDRSSPRPGRAWSGNASRRGGPRRRCSPAAVPGRAPRPRVASPGRVADRALHDRWSGRTCRSLRPWAAQRVT
jgi:hypothetical protein